MKTLKFAPYLVSLILSGEKTSTWRLFDDKELVAGDVLRLVNKETGEAFAVARIVAVEEKALGKIGDEDFSGHERFESTEKMFEAYRGYYGDKVNENTVVKMIDFEVLLKYGAHRHYKGKEYEVLGVARHSETLEDMVVYRALYGDLETWARPLAMFIGEIEVEGKKMPRFAYVGE